MVLQYIAETLLNGPLNLVGHFCSDHNLLKLQNQNISPSIEQNVIILTSIRQIDKGAQYMFKIIRETVSKMKNSFWDNSKRDDEGRWVICNDWLAQWNLIFWNKYNSAKGAGWTSLLQMLHGNPGEVEGLL